MNEPTSQPNPRSDEESAPELPRELELVPVIAKEEAQVASSDLSFAEKEQQALEGETKESAFAQQLGEKEARADEEIETLRLTNERLKAELAAFKSRTKEEKRLYRVRRSYTNKLFRVTMVWLIIVVIFVLANGIKFRTTNFSLNQDNGENFTLYFNLPEGVLVAFITSTTIAVIGLFVIVAKWLFRSSENEDIVKKDK